METRKCRRSGLNILCVRREGACVRRSGDFVFSFSEGAGGVSYDTVRCDVTDLSPSILTQLIYFLIGVLE